MNYDFIGSCLSKTPNPKASTLMSKKIREWNHWKNFPSFSFKNLQYIVTFVCVNHLKQFMKNFVFLLIVFFVCMITSNTTAQTPTFKWSFDPHDASFGQTAAADIDKDGKLELVFGCYRNDSCVYAINAENGTLLWKYNTHPAGYEGCNDVAPIIYDIDHDDTLEVIVPSSCNPITFCFNGMTGALKWQTITFGSDSPPTIADIDNDGKLEILHGEFGGYVICINGENGSIKWNIPVDVSTANTRINTAPTIVDLNNDGQLDFVVCSWKGDTNKIFAFRGNDHVLLWSHPINDWVYHGTAVSDLDHDGKPELVIGDYSGKLYVLNGEDGSEAWTYTYNSSYYIGSPASIADLDGDGNCEIVISAWYKIIALRHDSTVFWEYSIPNYPSAFRGVVLADIDNDDLPDAIFGTDNGMVIALKGTTGDTLWTLNLAALYGNTFEIDNAPIIADFDHDGNLDMFIIGGHAEYPNFPLDYGRGYAFSIGPGKGPDWLMFQHDQYRQSSLCGFTPATVPFESNIEPNIQVFPNPSNTAVTIQFPNPDSKTFNVQIFNALGESVLKIDAVSNNQITIEKNVLSKGMFFFQLRNSRQMISQAKFIIQ